MDLDLTNPRQRKQAEDLYERLYSLYESGGIREGELQTLQDLHAQMTPIWEQEAALEAEQSQPIMYDPQIGVPSLGIEPQIKSALSYARDFAVDTLPPDIVNNIFGRPASKDFMDQAGLLGLSGADLATRLADAPRNAYEGNYGTAAADLGWGGLGLLGLATMAAPGKAMERSLRAAGLNTRTGAPAGLGVTAEALYNIGDRLAAPGSYRAISGKPSTVGIPDIGTFEARPINPIEQAAREYMERRGMDTTPLTSYPKQDPARARLIGAAYDAMRDDPYNPAVRRAYDAMVQETLDQYNALKNSGIEFKFLQEGMSDPYARSPAMGYQDLVENGRLWVFPTDFGYGSQTGSAFFDPSTNPLLRGVGRIGDKADAVANDAFRAVHDTYGHFGPGNPFFRAPGEERAWIEHSRMYSPEARGAMTSETRGQNSWLNFGPYAEHNRTALGADTRFADQKIGLMDDWVTELYGMPDDEQRAILERIMRGW